ncbi:MAG: hypothetical protein P4L48_17260 [Mycobacterium sp.]|nr:hypothetical protein [Mycobacterium sp.]HKI40832.1 hypothetical protein [Mycobacterium sp.]
MAPTFRLPDNIAFSDALNPFSAALNSTPSEPRLGSEIGGSPRPPESPPVSASPRSAPIAGRLGSPTGGNPGNPGNVNENGGPVRASGG